MIVKFFELEKTNLKENNLLLLYGSNEGLKEEAIKGLLRNKTNISNYDENDFLNNKEVFLENILSKSFFDNEKVIIIKRSTDKILKFIQSVIDRNIEDTIIIIDANNLEKKSKLRTFFEKNKKLICTAFYPDNDKTLMRITNSFLKEKKISISQANINILIEKCNGDRGNLKNELNKIEYFCKQGKKLNTENIFKLVNLFENTNISELVDNCLAKNERKTIKMLNENNFSNDDCILITRTFLKKSKKILKLSNEYQKNKDMNLTILSAKPPIFWKDKEITKTQIFKWNPKKISQLIYKINELEFLIKKNVINPINLVTDFILYNSTNRSNN